jgi:hypothetical protein
MADANSEGLFITHCHEGSIGVELLFSIGVIHNGTFLHTF